MFIRHTFESPSGNSRRITYHKDSRRAVLSTNGFIQASWQTDNIKPHIDIVRRYAEQDAVFTSSVVFHIQFLHL